MSSVVMRSENGQILFSAPRKFSAFPDLFFPAVFGVFAYALFFDQRTTLAFKVIGTPFLAVLIYVWVRSELGTEVLEISPDLLTHRYVLLGLSQKKQYEARLIQAPHFLANIPGRRGQQSSIAFVYAGRHTRICNGISQPKAKELVTTMLREFPQLAGAFGNYAEGVPGPADGDVSLKLN